MHVHSMTHQHGTDYSLTLITKCKTLTVTKVQKC